MVAHRSNDVPAQILIVDREIAEVEPLRMALALNGFVVRAITDRAAAVVAITTRPPQLVILDWNMPQYGGLELIDVVRRTLRVQPIGLIILSSLATDYDVVHGLNLGADDYVAKPFSLPEMVARTRAVLRSRTGLKLPALRG